MNMKVTRDDSVKTDLIPLAKFGSSVKKKN